MCRLRRLFILLDSRFHGNGRGMREWAGGFYQVGDFAGDFYWISLFRGYKLNGSFPFCSDEGLFVDVSLEIMP